MANNEENKLPWENVKYPEDVIHGNADDYHLLRMGDFYDNAVLLNDYHVRENEDRHENHP